MERVWNIVHYFVYVSVTKAQRLTLAVNPVTFVYRTRFFRNYFSRRGRNIFQEIEQNMENPDTGINTIWAGGLLAGLVGLVGLGLVLLYIAEINPQFHLGKLHGVAIAATSYVLNYLLLWRHGKYLNYFKECDKLPAKIRRRWAWISFGIIVGMLAFSVCRFLHMHFQWNPRLP